MTMRAERHSAVAANETIGVHFAGGSATRAGTALAIRLLTFRDGDCVVALAIRSPDGAHAATIRLGANGLRRVIGLLEQALVALEHGEAKQRRETW